MSFEALNIGASALYAAQRAAEVSAHNVANAANDNYTRQRVVLQAATPSIGTPGMRGTGVELVSISRVRDSLADVSYRAQAAPAGAADARANVLTRAESVLGPYAEGVPQALDQFFAAWNQLSLNPTDPASRTAVLEQGNVLAGSLNDAATNMQQVATDTYNQVQQNVAAVNQLAGQIATLNKQIASAVVGGQNPNDLLDQRDAAIDQLSTLTGASVRVSGSTQQAQLYVGGQLLVDGTATESLGTSRVNGQVAFTLDGKTMMPAGTLGGLAQALNVDLPGFSAHLDALAAGIATQVNKVHAQGYNMVDPATNADGTAAAPTGGDFFSGTTALGLRVALTSPGQIAASATGNVNDGNNAITMAGVADLPAFRYPATGDLTPQPLAATDTAQPGDVTIGDALRGLVGRLGSASSNAQAVQQATASSLDAAQALRTDADGVSTDEEMVDLVKYQHSYEAAARVISVADAMLDTLINHTGAG